MKLLAASLLSLGISYSSAQTLRSEGPLFGSQSGFTGSYSDYAPSVGNSRGRSWGGSSSFTSTFDPLSFVTNSIPTSSTGLTFSGFPSSSFNGHTFSGGFTFPGAATQNTQGSTDPIPIGTFTIATTPTATTTAQTNTPVTTPAQTDSTGPIPTTTAPITTPTIPTTATIPPAPIAP